MKKFFLSMILACVAIVYADAQYFNTLNDPDTMKIKLESEAVEKYLSTDVMNVNFNDPKSITINTYDGKEYKYDRSSIVDVSFSNRYSNPSSLLKAERFGAYEGLFVTNNCREYDTFYLLSCLAGDEMLGGGGILDNWHAYDFLAQKSFPQFASLENATYETIFKINDLIKKVEDFPSDIDPKVAAHTKGEMIFLRAYHHYELASIFGNIQYITDNNSWEQRLKTFTPEGVWGSMMLDLKNAINLMDASLCPSLQEDGRVSRYAAEAMLARAFLFYTGFYQGKHDIAKEDAEVELPDGSVLTKQNVVDYLNDCIENSPFRLVSDFRNLWPYTNRYTVEANPETAGKGLKWVEDDGAINPEVLFKIRYNTNATWQFSYGPAYSNTYALEFGHRLVSDNYERLFPMGGGWGAGTVAPNLWDDWYSWEPNDMRRDASIQDIITSDFYNGDNSGDCAQLTRYHDKKISPVIGKRNGEYGDEYDIFELWMFHPEEHSSLGNDFQGGSIHPLNLIRLSDVLLMHSELTGTTMGINQVRQRAGLEPIKNYSLLDLQQERRWELAFEGVRWNDMRRWGDEYCKRALDRQVNVQIKNRRDLVWNSGSLFGLDDYSQQYDKTHGFFKSSDDERPCKQAYTILEGTWYLGSLNGITFGTLNSKDVTAADFFKSQKGLIEGYTIDEMKKQEGYAKGEISKYSYMQIIDKYINTVSSLSNTIGMGEIELVETDNYDWRVCSAKVTNNAILGLKASEVDILTIDGNTIVMVESVAPGTPAKFCVLQKGNNYYDYSIHRIANKKWSFSYNKNYGINPETGEPLGWTMPWGYGGYKTNTGLSVPGIYCNQYGGAEIEQLSDYATAWNLQEKRDADPYAYMMFDLYNETVNKYTRDGELISQSPFECKHPEGSFAQQQEITIHDGGILFPYRYNGNGEKVENFTMVLTIHGFSEAGNYYALALREDGVDDGFTTWLFGERGITPEELDDLVVIEQYDKEYDPAENGCYFKISFKDNKDREYNYECVDGTEIIKTSDGYLRVKAEKGTIVDKEIRVSVINNNNDTVYATKKLTFNMDLKAPKEVVIYENADGAYGHAWNAADLRFSVYEGMNFPYITDEQYTELIGNNLHVVIKEAAEGTKMNVMTGWWSPTFYTNLPVATGDDLEIPITEQIANACMRGTGGHDLTLVVTAGYAIVSKVYYLKE